MKIKLESAKEQVEKCTNQGKQRHAEITTKTTDEIKKSTVINVTIKKYSQVYSLIKQRHVTYYYKF